MDTSITTDFLTFVDYDTATACATCAKQTVVRVVTRGAHRPETLIKAGMTGVYAYELHAELKTTLGLMAAGYLAEALMTWRKERAEEREVMEELES